MSHLKLHGVRPMSMSGGGSSGDGVTGNATQAVANVLTSMSGDDARSVFWSGMAFEAGLGIVALAIARLFKTAPLLDRGAYSAPWSVALGLAWSLPLILGLLYLRTFKGENFKCESRAALISS